MADQKVFNYPGKDVDVHWDSRLCIHIGECGYSEGDLFVGGRDPWCVPDVTNSTEVMEVCERCPTGALTYTDKSGESEKAATNNTIQVTYNGPLYIQGELDIEGAEDLPGTRFRAALCRCGASKNKPFCDNSHLTEKFEDYAAVGPKGPGLSSSSGPLSIKAIKDGPLILNGNMTIVSGSGRAAWQGEKVGLCRCGASKNKPFCDGTHMSIGFTSDD